MTLQQIDRDTVQPNGKKGVPARAGFGVVNDNTTETESRLQVLESGASGVSTRLDDAEEAIADNAEAIAAQAQAVAAEAAARQQGDTALQQAIAAEANSRGSADTVLQQGIDGEASARLAGDNALAQQIAAVLALTGENPLINFGFDWWFRGTSFTNAGAGVQQTADRWATYAANCTIVAAQQVWPVNPYASGYPENGKYYHRCTVSGVGSTSQAYAYQKIENVESKAGRQITISWWGRSSVAANKVGVRVIQNFGTGGSAAVSTEAGTVTPGASTVSRMSVTLTVPNTAGKTVGNDSNLQIVFDFVQTSAMYGGALVSQAGYFDIGGVQIDDGPTMKAYRPRNAQLDRMLCGLYLIRMTNGSVDQSGIGANRINLGQANAYSTTSVMCYVPLPYVMRGVPAITLSAAAAWRFLSNGSGPALSAISVGEIGTNGFTVTGTVASATLGAGGRIQTGDSYSSGYGWMADCEIN